MRTCKNDKKEWGEQILRIVLSACVFLLMGGSVVWAAEEDVTIDGLIYTLDDATMTAKVKGVEDKSISYVNIPGKISNKDGVYKVTVIGYQCFYRCEELESINIPSSVTEIHGYGIASCDKLTTLVLPSSVKKLDYYAIAYNSNLTSVKLSENLTELPFACFAGCRMLPSVTIPSSVKVLGRSCFGYCSNLKTVVIMSEDFSMEALCFHDCSNLKTFVTHCENPQKAEYEETAHWGKIPQVPRWGKNLYVPKESVNSYRYADCWNTWENIEPLENYVEEEDENPWTLELVDGRYYVAGMYFELNEQDKTASFTGVNEYYYSTKQPGEGSDPKYWVYNIYIPMYVYYQSKEYTVTRMSDGCLNGYLYLSKVSIPSSVKEIGNDCFAFAGFSFTSLPEGVEKVGDRCFSDSFVYKMEFPSSVTSIGDRCFFGCSYLSSVIIRSPNLTKIGKGCFIECISLSELVCYSNQVPTFEYYEWDREQMSPFSRTKASEGTLYVQKELVDAYRAAEGWNEWKNILPIEAYGQVDGIENQSRDVKDNGVIYDLQGRKVTTPQKNGLYIKNGKKFIAR